MRGIKLKKRLRQWEQLKSITLKELNNYWQNHGGHIAASFGKFINFISSFITKLFALLNLSAFEFISKLISWESCLRS